MLPYISLLIFYCSYTITFSLLPLPYSPNYFNISLNIVWWSSTASVCCLTLSNQIYSISIIVSINYFKNQANNINSDSKLVKIVMQRQKHHCHKKITWLEIPLSQTCINPLTILHVKVFGNEKVFHITWIGMQCNIQ